MSRKSIYITIPQPCHENWQNMDATARGDPDLEKPQRQLEIPPSQDLQQKGIKRKKNHKKN